MRTQDEIRERVRDFAVGKEDDILGFRTGALIEFLDFDHAREFLRPEATKEEWEQDISYTDEAVRKTAFEYLDFAFGKARNHRGISANRSAEKLSEWAWVLGRDDVVEAMAAAPYPQYGVPKLKAFVEGFGLPWPGDDTILANMAEGRFCSPGCNDGCGS